MRVFQDRLVDTADRTYLQRLLHALLKSRFDTKLSYEVSNVVPCLTVACRLDGVITGHNTTTVLVCTATVTATTLVTIQKIEQSITAVRSLELCS